MKLSKELYQGEFLVGFAVTVFQIVIESERENMIMNIIIGSNKMLLDNKYANLKFVYIA